MHCNPYKSSKTKVPENLRTIRWLILVYKADQYILKTYRYFVVMHYILQENVNLFKFLKCPVKKYVLNTMTNFGMQIRSI